MRKLLARWTIGGNQPLQSVEILSHAVDQFKKLYPKASLAICQNNLPKKHKKFIKVIAARNNAQIIEQEKINYPIKPRKAEWLLWPGRLQLFTHEIMMDNDVVLLKRHPIIDEFLESDDLFFATESQSDTMYGNYRSVVPSNGLSINSGLYGVPPYFDVEQFYTNLYREFGSRQYDHTNPQGVVAYMIKTNKHRIIRKKDIRIVGQSKKGADSMVKSKKELNDIHGLHFVGINRNFLHRWKFYCSMIGRKSEFN